MKFYLGTHQPGWLWNEEASFPMFVSHRRLSAYATLRPSTARWALDSGGFTELSQFGEWRTSPREYATAVARYQREIGSLDWAAPQDWMCEPWIVHGTGLTVREHQQRTTENFLELAQLWPSVSDRRNPFIPVLQGWETDDYLGHAAMYAAAGVFSLPAGPVVGVGSVCRRQGTAEIARLMKLLGSAFRLHAFGVKTKGLGQFAGDIISADSMAWSYDARRNPPLPGCTGHKNCANCLRYASRWRTALLGKLEMTP